MKNIELKIVGGFFAILLIVVIIAFWTENHKETSKIDVAVQLAIDSVKSDISKQTQQREDSIQREALKRDSLWQIALQAKQAEANKYYNANVKNANTIKELKEKYAEPCREIITEYDKREDNYIKAIQAEKVALTVCENRVVEWKSISASKEAQLTAAHSLIKTKNETIATQRDRLTTITNRADRNWIHRNYLWATGQWHDYVFGE